MKQTIQNRRFFNPATGGKDFQSIPFYKEKSFRRSRLWKIPRRLKKVFLNEEALGFPWKERFGKIPKRVKKARLLLNSKGQGLIEYLILVALMAVATIGIIRTLNQTVKSRFANSIYALQGRNQKAKTHSLKKEEYQRSDLSNFMSGATSSDKKRRSKK